MKRVLVLIIVAGLGVLWLLSCGDDADNQPIPQCKPYSSRCR